MKNNEKTESGNYSISDRIFLSELVPVNLRIKVIRKFLRNFQFKVIRVTTFNLRTNIGMFRKFSDKPRSIKDFLDSSIKKNELVLLEIHNLYNVFNLSEIESIEIFGDPIVLSRFKENRFSS